MRITSSRWGRRAALLVLQVLALFAMAEVAARLLWEPSGESALDSLHQGMEMQAHPTRMWSIRPGERASFGITIRVDADGLRESPQVGTDLRALVVGDSSFFGHGLEDEDTLHVLLGSALATRGIEVDVLCGGVPGYSMPQTLILMDEVGWDLDPDLLIIGSLWSDNTFDTFVDREWLVLLNTPQMRLNRTLSLARSWQWLREEVFPTPSKLQTSTTNVVSWIREPYKKGRRRVSLTDYASDLDRILREAAERNIGAVVLQPVNRDRLRGVTPATWDPYFEAQVEVALRRGVSLVDGLQVLQAGGLDVEAAFLDEMHPTGSANRLYAEALADALTEAGWPGEPMLPDLQPAPFDREIEDVWAEPLAPYQEGIVPIGPPRQ